MAPQVNSVKRLEKNTCPPETLPENCRGRNAPAITLIAKPDSDTTKKKIIQQYQ